MEENYLEETRKFIAKHKLKLGDKLKVLCTAETRERGWQNSWEPEMTASVGKLGTIMYLNPNDSAGISLSIDGVDQRNFGFPYFVLGSPRKKIG